jgi:hypothetical protein
MFSIVEINCFELQKIKPPAFPFSGESGGSSKENLT